MFLVYNRQAFYPASQTTLKRWTAAPAMAARTQIQVLLRREDHVRGVGIDVPEVCHTQKVQIL